MTGPPRRSLALIAVKLVLRTGELGLAALIVQQPSLYALAVAVGDLPGRAGPARALVEAERGAVIAHPPAAVLRFHAPLVANVVADPAERPTLSVAIWNFARPAVVAIAFVEIARETIEVPSRDAITVPISPPRCGKATARATGDLVTRALACAVLAHRRQVHSEDGNAEWRIATRGHAFDQFRHQVVVENLACGAADRDDSCLAARAVFDCPQRTELIDGDPVRHRQGRVALRGSPVDRPRHGV